MSHTTAVSHTAEQLFLSRLKADTSALHRKLERAPVSANLMNPSVTKQQYMQYLAAMRQVIAWTESQVFPIIEPIINDIESRRKLHTIDRDLDNLQWFAHDLHSDFNPSVSSMSPSVLLGFMYVVEGSSLGGMVILKHLQPQDFITPDTTNFLTTYGEQIGTYWKKFSMTMSAYTVKNRIESDVIQGARDAFNAIDEYFLSVSN